jgi:hypothetical protein
VLSNAPEAPADLPDFLRIHLVFLTPFVVLTDLPKLSLDVDRFIRILGYLFAPSKGLTKGVECWCNEYQKER